MIETKTLTRRTQRTFWLRHRRFAPSVPVDQPNTVGANSALTESELNDDH